MRSFVVWLLIFASLAACKTTQKAGSTGPDNGSALNTDLRRQVDFHYVEGCTFMMRGDYPNAEAKFRQVLKLDPSNHAAMYNIARLAVEQRKFNEAIDFGKDAIKRDPDNIWYYKITSEAYEAKGDFANSVAIQEQIVKRFSEKLDERLKLAELYLRNQRFDEAVEQLTYIEQQIGPNEETLLEKLKLYVRTDQNQQAVEVTEQLIRLSPTNSRYYELQYETYKQLGQEIPAIKTLERLLDQDPDNSFALLNLAEVYKKRGEVAISDEYLFKAFALPTVALSEKMRITQGLMQFYDRQPEVRPRVDKLVRLIEGAHPDAAGIYTLKGDLYAKSGQADSAAIYYRKSLDRDGSDQELWLSLLSASYQEDNFERLQKDAEEALEFFPNRAAFLFFYGLSSGELGDHDKAIYALEKIKKLGADSPDMLALAYLQLAEVYQKNDQHEKADENFELARKSNPEDPYILNSYAYHLSLRKSKLETAKELIAQAVALQPNEAAFEDTYAWVLYQMGQYEEAEKWALKALEHGRDAVFYEHYGDILLKLGRKDQAIAQWNKAIQEGATDLRIDEKIRQP